MVDEPVFEVASEIVVGQKKSHHLSTPRNWAMKFHQLPKQLNLLAMFKYKYPACDITNDVIMI